MDANEIAKIVKGLPNILELIYKDLAQPSVKKVGQALGTVFDLSNTILLPVKLLNEKARMNFKRHMNNYSEKINSIPDEKICQVPPEIGIPITEKLLYTTNQDIASLFINLLATASSQETINQAHPSFIHLIDRLSVDEARIVKYLKDKGLIPTITLRMTKNNNDYVDIHSKLSEIKNAVELIFPKNLENYMENLESMGIIYFVERTKNKMQQYVDPAIYSNLEMSNYNLLKENLDLPKEHIKNVEWIREYYKVSNFGRQFITACNENPH